MNKHIADLERQLAAAKQAEEKQWTDAFIAPFLEIAGKCFLYRDPTKRCNVTGFVKYSRSVKLEVSNGIPYAKMSNKRVFGQDVTRSYPFVGAILQANDHAYDRHSSFHDMTRWHVKEVSLAVFKDAWDSIQAIVPVFMHRWESDTETPSLQEYRAEPKGDLDLPHVALEGMERSLVGESVFLIGDLYLLTPNSIALALARIAEDEAKEARCSHLYEECDMKYVEHKRKARNSIRRKLMETPK